MKKLYLMVTVLALSLSLVSPANAVPSPKSKAAPKATGSYGYEVYGLQRFAEFNAQATSDTCELTGWVLTGTNTVNIPWAGTTYTYSVTFDQDGTNLTGSLYDPYYPWTNTLTGSVVGSLVDFTYPYPAGSIQGLRHYVGAIDSAGNVSGTWTETGTENGSGDWSTGTAAHKEVMGCNGKGEFHYSDVAGTYYSVDVKYVSVEGNTAWFAGPVVSGNWGNYGTWLFVKVVDNGEPGNADVTAGDAGLTEAQASYLVATHGNPSIESTINSGNIQVH